MSDLRKNAVALLCSDLHLRTAVPSSRIERSWYPEMERHLDAIATMAGDLPIICAGDVFDRWNPPSELVSWALDCLPQMFAIPGQHDLNGHDYDRRMEGAYGVLVKAGIIIDLPAERWCNVSFESHEINIWANPWGRYLLPKQKPAKGICLQVIHKYVYDTPIHAYKDAPTDGLQLSTPKNIDAVLSGDNHITWFRNNWFNPGSLMQLKSDQKNHCPTLGYLHADGSIHAIPMLRLQTPKESWADTRTEENPALATETLEAIQGLQREDIGFSDRLLRVAETISHKELSSILMEVWEETRD